MIHSFSVTTESMVRPDGTGFPVGCTIYVDEERQPKVGDFVVYSSPEAGCLRFGEYVADGATTFLRALNPSFPIVAIRPNDLLLGTVEEMARSVKY